MTRSDGFAMAALLVMLAVMSVMLTVALPSWRQLVRREKEAELVFRGEQYARAIALFQRKYANALPPSVDVLVDQRFLRKKYKDPITGDDFVVLPASGLSLTPTSPQAASTPGATASPIQTPPIRPGSALQSPSNRPFYQPSQPSSPSTPFGAGGGIAGVTSKSKDESLRVYNGRRHYNEWQFTYLASATRPGFGPGVPGGRGGVRPGSPVVPTPGGRGLTPAGPFPTFPKR